jgi:hypothetical protein
MDAMSTVGTALTKKKRRLFIDALANSGNVSLACKHAVVSRCGVYKLKSRSKEFEREWKDAIDQAVSILEEEARRRALNGVDEPVFHGGKVCGVVRKYSDVLLIFLLKASRPKKYRERYDLSGTQTVDVSWTNLVKSVGGVDGGKKTYSGGKKKGG